MRIAVLSDIHDSVWKLAAALDAVGDADGGTTDVASTFMIYDTATGEVPGFEVSGSGSLPRNP
jgi:hypothetical protein